MEGSDRKAMVIDNRKKFKAKIDKVNYLEESYEISDLEGKILKEAKDEEGVKSNIAEVDAWRSLTSNEKYGSRLCPVRALFDEGMYVVMERAKEPH